MGAALVIWGRFRLQRAKAERTDLTWWQYLRSDIIMLGIAALLIGGFMAMPHTAREELIRTITDFYNQLGIAKGGP
jgi:hypothetical protein